MATDIYLSAKFSKGIVRNMNSQKWRKITIMNILANIFKNVRQCLCRWQQLYPQFISSKIAWNLKNSGGVQPKEFMFYRSFWNVHVLFSHIFIGSEAVSLKTSTEDYFRRLFYLSKLYIFDAIALNQKRRSVKREI